jgi:uncharacterized membrane protein
MKSARKVITELALMVLAVAALLFVVSVLTGALKMLAWSGIVALAALTVFLLYAKFDNDNYVRHLRHRDTES